MTQINHHLTDALLMSYAAGTLPEAFNLVVASHISLCDECRARLGAFEAVGGGLLTEIGEAEVMADVEDVLARAEAIDSEIDMSGFQAEAGIFPRALQEYVGGDLSAVRWRPVGMGVKQAILKTSKSANVRLLYIPAGAQMPDHGHRGTELTLVLRGAFRDQDEHFARGDIEIATEADAHTPIADEGVACICLAATDAPLKFQGLVPRIVQKFVRI